MSLTWCSLRGFFLSIRHDLRPWRRQRRRRFEVHCAVVGPAPPPAGSHPGCGDPATPILNPARGSVDSAASASTSARRRRDQRRSVTSSGHSRAIFAARQGKVPGSLFVHRPRPRNSRAPAFWTAGGDEGRHCGGGRPACPSVSTKNESRIREIVGRAGPMNAPAAAPGLGFRIAGLLDRRRRRGSALWGRASRLPVSLEEERVAYPRDRGTRRSHERFRVHARAWIPQPRPSGPPKAAQRRPIGVVAWVVSCECAPRTATHPHPAAVRAVLALR
jgi:hypothetical protein